jgi:hypothetical protein
MSDDWRIHIQLPEEHRAQGLLGKLGLELSTDDAQRLANELKGHRLAVSVDDEDNELFVYASSHAEAEQARAIVEAELADEGVQAQVSQPERWLREEERWSDEPPDETWEEEELEHGAAPWEVRIERESHAEAEKLADELEREGYRPVRRWQYLIVGTSTREEAEALALRLHGEAEPAGQLAWEVAPGNPFAVFGGMGGSGTPL